MYSKLDYAKNYCIKKGAYADLQYPYRNRRKRFGLRMNLICALINIDAKPTGMEVEGNGG